MRGATALAALPLLLLAGCATTSPEEDPVQIKLRELDGRLARTERVISNQSLLELSQRLDAVQSELRELRGRMDELENASTALRKQQRDLYGDLDRRLTVLQGGAPAGAVPSSGSTGTAGAAVGNAPAAGTTTPSGGSVEQTVYAQAFDAMKAGSYSVAIKGFKDFLANYPQSPLAENAEYWLGEAYYVNHDYDAAASAFRTVLTRWPDSHKAPDALLKLAYTQFEQKKPAEAKATLAEVTRKYPDSDAAKLASERLKKLNAK